MSSLYSLLLLLILILKPGETQENPKLKESGVYGERMQPRKDKGIPIKNSTKSRGALDEEGFKDFKIYLDQTNIKCCLIKYNLTKYYDLFLNSIQQSINILEKILKVRPLQKDHYIRNKRIMEFGVDKINNEKFGKVGEGFYMLSTGYDLIIFGRFDDLGDSLLVKAEPLMSEENGRPFIGRINFNCRADYSNQRIPKDLKFLILNEIINVLGILDSYTEHYSHRVFRKEDSFGINKTFINSSEASELRKNKFDFPDLDKVKPEFPLKNGLFRSNWGMKIFLDEHKNRNIYSALELLEDTGFYKLNYYPKKSNMKDMIYKNQNFSNISNTKEKIFNQKKIKLRKLSSENSITITIKGTGECSIISEDYSTLPDSITINENPGSISRTQNLVQDTNTIVMKWNSQITTCKNMFKNVQKIIKIDLTQFDFSLVDNMESFFEGCQSLTSVDFTGVDASKTKNMSNLFKDCKLLESVDFTNFITNDIEDLSYMFYGCEKIESIDLSSFHTPNLLTLYSTFGYCKALKQINFGNMDTSKVTDMDGMFQFCNNLVSLDLTKFLTPALETVNEMFTQCHSLKSLDLSSFNTPSLRMLRAMFYNCNQLKTLDISNFDTSKVTNMAQVFYQCQSIEVLNLSHFKTSSVEVIQQMFYYCKKLSLLDISNFDTHQITDMDNLFYKCESLKTLNLKSFNTSQVERMDYMFFGCKILENLDISNFNTENVKRMDFMFKSCSKLKSLDLSHFYTPKLEKMNEIFCNCESLEFLDVSNFDTSKVKDMSYIFHYCISLSSINIPNFDTTLVTNMDSMFRYCKKISYLNISHFKTEALSDIKDMFNGCLILKSLDLSNFNTPNLNSMIDLFQDCEQLEFLDITNLNTAGVKDMSKVFLNCHSLKSIDIQNFDTSLVTDMKEMFNNCQELTSLNLNNFRTPLVNNMNKMFANCISLTSLDLQNFDTKNVKRMDYLFNNCKALKYLNIRNFDTSKVSNFGHMFDQCEVLDSLDLSHFDTNLVEDMTNMFYGCKSLKYLDVSNFNTKKITNMKTLFKDTQSLLSLNLSSFDIYDSTDVIDFLLQTYDGIILCYNETKMPSHFIEQVKDYHNSCKDLCIMNSKKFILDIEMCVNNCFGEIEYKYEYQDICYKHCPIRTQIKPGSSYLCEDCPHYYNFEQTGCIDTIPEGFYSNSDSLKTIAQCPPKCKTCSFESMQNTLCILCNTDGHFYSKEGDPLNINSFYECYDSTQNQEKYYLDIANHIYKPCHPNCKNCFGEGDDINNKCEECINDNYIKTTEGNCLIREPDTSNIENDDSTNKIEENESSNVNQNQDTSSHIESEVDTHEVNQKESTSQMSRTINNAQIESSYYYDQSSETNKIGISWNIIIPEKKENKYSYDITSVSDDIKNKFSIVYMDISTETINFIRNKFGLSNNERIFVTITEKNNSASNFATVDHICEFTLENGTVLNMNDVEEDIYIEVYVPITDLEIAQFDLIKEFAEQGYDIYDINSEFYNDFCTPAYINGNDITLKDRKKDIYPHNVTLCKSNCKYNGINIDEQRVICSCNLNSDRNIEDNKTLIVDDEGDFGSYLLDKINYRIFMCYKLFFNVKNLKKSYAFYIILIIFLILLILNMIFICHSLNKLKLLLVKEMPMNKALSKGENVDDKQKNDDEPNLVGSTNPPKKKKQKTKKKNFSKTTKNVKKNVFLDVRNDNNYVDDPFSTHENINTKKRSKRKRNSEKIKKIKTSNSNDDLLKAEEKEEKINELPYSKAVKVDKRNICQIFYSFIVEKLELISITCSDNSIKAILYSEYILALIANFFFNALLYSDDVVSNKYHNNGKLDFLVSLVLSIISNIVTSIICYYIKYSRGVEERIDLISELKYNKYFDMNIKRLLKYLKIKFILFFLCQVIITGICIYYVVIFGILYSHSQVSLLINYCYSLIESIITAFAITFVILITRKIGLSCLNKELYNTSKYIDSKF